MLAEIKQYLHVIEQLRGQVADIVRELPAEALNWRPVSLAAGEDDHATNSLAVLAAHVAGSEHFWMAEVIDRQTATRVRAEEFVTEVDDAAGLIKKLEAVAEETREIMERLTAADLEEERSAGERIVPVRWAILHVVEHIGLHLGHMQLTYQLWRGGQSQSEYRWYENLPNP